MEDAQNTTMKVRINENTNDIKHPPLPNEDSTENYAFDDKCDNLGDYMTLSNKALYENISKLNKIMLRNTISNDITDISIGKVNKDIPIDECETPSKVLDNETNEKRIFILSGDFKDVSENMTKKDFSITRSNIEIDIRDTQESVNKDNRNFTISPNFLNAMINYEQHSTINRDKRKSTLNSLAQIDKKDSEDMLIYNNVLQHIPDNATASDIQEGNIQKEQCKRHENRDIKSTGLLNSTRISYHNVIKNVAEITDNVTDSKTIRDATEITSKYCDGNTSTNNGKFLKNWTKNKHCTDNNDGENIYGNVSQNEKSVKASDTDVTAEIVNKFVGPVFQSFRDKPHKNYWRKKCPSNWEDGRPEAELSRSQYSLVSCNDLTAGAVQLWLGLPEEVKYDPALAPFRQFYEKEHGKLQEGKRNGSTKKQRLPSVNSAPHLNNNHQVVRDEPFSSSDKHSEKLEKLHEEQITTIPKKSMGQKARHYTKMTLLLACWVFFTTAFLMYNEKEPVTRNSSAAPFEVKSYPITSPQDRFSMLLQLSGPFLSETNEMRMNFSMAAVAKKMEVWVERVHLAEGRIEVVQTSDTWKLVLQDEEALDFSEGEPRFTTLSLKSFASAVSNVTSTFILRIRTTANHTTPFAMTYTLNPLDVHTGVIYACILLLGLYVLIIFEVINRTMAAVLVSTAALATLAIVGERPTLPEIISWLDVETLLLLFSMMLLVAIMAETGMFDFLAVFTFEVTKGKLWPLISLLCTITAVLSTFLDNVTTVLLMTPVTIRLCEVMDLDPIPILMSMVIFSNIGGTVTPVGDPPNVIIASNKAVVQSGINFTNFTLHMTLGILLVCVQTYIQLRFMYRDANKLRLHESRDIQDLRHQISIWRRAAESLPHMSRDEQVVRERLERKVKKLTTQLESLVKESNKRACPKDTFRSTLNEMKEKYKIRDKPLLIKSSIAIGFVVAVFFLHSIPELNRVSLGWTALLGAILLLTLADREDLEPILHRVEWSTLLFFAALFVLMEALSKLGLIAFIGGLTESIILSVDESARLAVAILLMLWVSGITSAFVDNIPLTTMMVRIVTSLGSNPTLNLPMAPLIWALSFGACLGGNGTLIGASANVVCAGVAEQHGYKFSFMQFFKIGFPIMLGHLVVASGYLMFCHCLFTWH